MLNHLLAKLREASWLSQIARKLAHRCQPQVERTVDSRVLLMTLSEARGYIRAKATPVLLAEMLKVLQREPDLLLHEQQAILDAASDLIVRDVLHSTMRGVTFELRRAA